MGKKYGSKLLGGIVLIPIGLIGLPYFIARQVLCKDPVPQHPKSRYIFKCAAKVLSLMFKASRIVWNCIKLPVQMVGGFAFRLVTGAVSIGASIFELGKRGISPNGNVTGFARNLGHRIAHTGIEAASRFVKFGATILKPVLSIVLLPFTLPASLFLHEPKEKTFLETCYQTITAPARYLASKTSSFSSICEKQGNKIQDKIIEFNKTDTFAHERSRETNFIVKKMTSAFIKTKNTIGALLSAVRDKTDRKLAQTLQAIAQKDQRAQDEKNQTYTMHHKTFIKEHFDRPCRVTFRRGHDERSPDESIFTPTMPKPSHPFSAETSVASPLHPRDRRNVNFDDRDDSRDLLPPRSPMPISQQLSLFFHNPLSSNVNLTLDNYNFHIEKSSVPNTYHQVRYVASPGASVETHNTLQIKTNDESQIKKIKVTALKTAATDEEKKVAIRASMLLADRNHADFLTVSDKASTAHLQLMLTVFNELKSTFISQKLRESQLRTRKGIVINEAEIASRLIAQAPITQMEIEPQEEAQPAPSSRFLSVLGIFSPEQSVRRSAIPAAMTHGR